MFSENWLGRAHDSVPTADLDAFANRERLLVVETAGCHYLFAAQKFIAIVDPSHRGIRTIRATSAESLVDREGVDLSRRRQ